MTTQSFQRSHELVSVLRGFTLADQSQSLLLNRLDARLTFLGGERQALAVHARRVRKDLMVCLSVCVQSDRAAGREAAGDESHAP